MFNLLKKIKLVVFLSLLLTVACNNNNKETDITFDEINNPATAEDNSGEELLGMPKIQFEETDYNFGEIIEGEIVSHTFKFKNTGQSNLIIYNAEASCGCTVPSYSDKPIKPNHFGEISIAFDSKGRDGFQEKHVTLLTNTNPNKKILKIKCIVVMPENKH